MGHIRLDFVLDEAAKSTHPYKKIATGYAGISEDEGFMGDYNVNSIVGDILAKIRDEICDRWVPMPTLDDGTVIERGMAVKGGVVDHYEVDCAASEWGNWRLYSEADGCFAEGTLSQYVEPAPVSELVAEEMRAQLESRPDDIPRAAIFRWMKMLESK